MTALCQLGHDSFRSGQPEVHLSRFRESGVLGMTAELCRAVPMVLSRYDDAHYKVWLNIAQLSEVSREE
jgi:hypothetical protein